MEPKTSQREFLSIALVTTSNVGAGTAEAIAISQFSPLTLRFRSHGIGGTYGYKFASLVMKWAGVLKSGIVRDWNFEDFSFVTISRPPLNLIFYEMREKGSSASVEVLRA